MLRMWRITNACAPFNWPHERFFPPLFVAQSVAEFFTDASLEAAIEQTSTRFILYLRWNDINHLLTGVNYRVIEFRLKILFFFFLQNIYTIPHRALRRFSISEILEKGLRESSIGEIMRIIAWKWIHNVLDVCNEYILIRQAMSLPKLKQSVEKRDVMTRLGERTK